MKKSMTDYISALTESDFSKLEEIIEDKYKKFLTMYWLLKDQSELINSLKYNDSDKNILKITISLLSDNDIDTVVCNLQANIPKDGSVVISSVKKKIHIEITKDEL